MGFFSDLKEDLSQAVNELMPEEALEAAMAGDAEGQDIISEGQLTDETPLVDEPLEKAVISPDSVDVSAKDTSLMTEAETAAEPEMAVMPEITEELELVSEPEITEELEPISDPGITEETEAMPEPVVGTESQTDNIISELSGEEEKIMDEQTQVQAQANRVLVDETAVVTEGMTITGDIVSEGSMELIGTVNGNLDILGKLNITGTIQGDSKAAEIFAEGAKITGEVNSQGSVKIGQSSVVIGNIAASSAVIAGAVKGDIDVHGPVILDTTAIVMGNIKSKSVQINNGAVIEGLCSQCYADVNPTSFFEEFKKKKG